MSTKYEKPPIGPLPRSVKLKERAEELSKAIHEYIIFYKDKKLKIVTLRAIQSWAEELIEILDALEEHSDV